MNQEALEAMFELLQTARAATDMSPTVHGTTAAFGEVMTSLRMAVEKVDDLCGKPPQKHL
jgi:hypothetical protein